jgi:hypothetical protein
MNTIKHQTPEKQKLNSDTSPQHQKNQSASFTYIGKETRKITKIIPGHPIQNSIQNAEHNTKLSETTYMKRQIQ